MAERKGKEIYVLAALSFFENMLLLSISGNSLQTLSSDEILNFSGRSNKVKQSFEIFLTDHCVCDISNKNISGT